MSKRMKNVPTKVIFNADDFGISLGVNAAIEKAYRKGILNAASLMVNQKYAVQAVEMSQKMENLDLGLHVNLTNEFSTLPHENLPLLTDEDGRFKHGFLGLLLLSIFKSKDMRREVKAEMEAQIQKAQDMGANLKHIDSHRHVHMIPLIFKEMLALKEKYGIGRMRVINESAAMTIKTNKNKQYLWDGGLLKYCLLKLFSILNGYQSNIYFYTMLYTCKLSKDHFQKILVPRGFDAVEIMIHPSITKIDEGHREDIFDQNVLSDWRDKEFETLTDKKILQNFEFNANYPFLFELYFKVEKIWFEKVHEKLRFLLVGGFNTVFAYGVYAFLLRLICLPYMFALALQYFITINVSVFTMRYYVFRSKGDFMAEFLKAWSVYLVLFFVNTLGLSFLVEICKIDELWAQGVYLIFSTIVTYLLHKYFSFSKKVNKKKDLKQ